MEDNIMFGFGLFQMFCLPALFGVFILSWFIYLRQEKNWLTNVVHGLLLLTLGVVCALGGGTVSPPASSHPEPKPPAQRSLPS